MKVHLTNEELEESKYLTCIQALLAIFVVYIHSYNEYNIEKLTRRDFELANISTSIQVVFSNGFFRIAVPIFMIISSFRFFSIVQKNNFIYRPYLIKRIKRYLVPYIFWSSFWLLVVILVSKYHPSNIISKTYEINSFSQTISAILFNPVPTQFWYLRDFIIYSMLAPIIIIFIKRFAKICLLIALGYWFFCENFNDFPGPDAFFAMVLGGILSFQKNGLIMSYSQSLNVTSQIENNSSPFRSFLNNYFNNDKIVNYILKLIIVFYFIFPVAIGFMHYYNISELKSLYPSFAIFNKLKFIKLEMINGILLFLSFGKQIGAFLCKTKFINFISTYTISIFLLHEPLQGAFIKIMHAQGFDSPICWLGLYLFSPILIINGVITVSYIGKKYFSKFYNTFFMQ